MTRFPQYPRRFRSDLTGIWDFEFISQNTATLPDLDPEAVNYTEKQVVPGCFDAAGTHAGHRGIGVYRTSVQIPHDGKYRLELGGLMLMGRIFLDGKEIGFDPYPFSGTAYEIEADAGRHELVIAVENRVSVPYNPLFQANYAFHTYAGILRSVVLSDLPQNHFGRASVTTLDVKSGLVRLDIEAPCASDGEFLAMTVQFDDGPAVTRNMTAENGVCSGEFTLPDPAPWTPENPALHTVRLILPDCADELVERFGLRTIEAKNAKLYLNGEEVMLRGFNRHDSHPEFGNAVPAAIMLEDLQILRSMHCNFIRGCHYPQSQEFLDLCDEFGFLVWEEAIASGNTKDDLAYDVFRQRQLDQTAMMIRNSRNHPSVILWGFLNEVDSRLPEAREFIAEMVGNIKSFDTSRPVTCASMYVGRGDICLDLVDVISCNTYPGWYETYVYEENSHTHIGPRFDEVVKTVSTPELKDKPLILSELGAAAIYGYRDRSRVPWSEEFQADELEETCRQLKLHPRFCGVAFWQFTDTRSYMRGGSNQARGFNNKGVLDEYRREKLAAEVVRNAFAEYK